MNELHNTPVSTPEKVYLFNDSKTFIIGAFINPDLCDKMIQYYNTSDMKYRDFVLDMGEKKNYDSSIRDNYSCPMQGSISEEYLSSLIHVFNLYYNFFPLAQTGTRSRIDYPVKIQKYDPPQGGYHSVHCERSTEFLNRHLVFMTYLNDVTDGGETEFVYQNLKVKPQKGLTLIWPSDWTYSHRGLKSPTQEKYIATGWLVITPESEWVE